MRFHNTAQNHGRGGEEKRWGWIARGAWESTRSRFRNPTVIAEDETVYNRLFGNIVDEQISETCSLVSKRNDKTILPPLFPFSTRT